MTGTARATLPGLEALRAAEFPWTAETVYLNAASIGPLPERTRRALEDFNRRRAEPHRLSDPELLAILTAARTLAARLVGAHPDEIALSTNTGFGLALAARTLPLRAGEIVLASDREFPANVYPWMRLADRGVTLELLPTTPEGWPDEARLLDRLSDPRVRAVAVSQVQFSSGYAVDLDRLSAATRASGAFLVVDAIQGLGQIPLDLAKTPVDVLSCGGQKWLLSPWGSGFTYVRRGLLERLDPPITGWMAFEGTDDFTRLTRYDATLRADARRFELISLPFQDFLGMTRSLELLFEIGIPRIEAHLRALVEPVQEWCRRRGVPLVSPEGPRASGIVSLAPSDPAAAYRALREAGVVASLREGAIRLSPHCYTTPDEMERVLAILDRVR